MTSRNRAIEAPAPQSVPPAGMVANDSQPEIGHRVSRFVARTAPAAGHPAISNRRQYR